MAGIAGIFCADGRPADVDALRRMVAPVAHRGADGIAYWNAGTVALAHMQFFTTPESLEERQPLVSAGGEACLVWNGRVDNRDELKAELAAAGVRTVEDTDPGLVLAAYLQWGTECVQRIVGDFVLALWDARTRKLWCARDYIGVRPFYYFWDGTTFAFGPEVRAVLQHPLVSLKINEGMVGEYLLRQITSREDTLYSDIRRLPPGSMLTIDSSRRLEVRLWWRPELSLLEYQTDEEYAAHFRELLDQSVRSQTRCHAGWGIELSGGLDSTSIAVSAREIRKAEQRGIEHDQIRTYSMTWPGKPWDESEDIEAVVQKAGFKAEFVRPKAVGLEFFKSRARDWREFPGNPNGEPMTIPIFEAARRDGVRVLLSGMGGDEWLDGYNSSEENLLDMALHPWRRGVLQKTAEQARHQWRIMGCPYGHWSLYLTRCLAKSAAPEPIIALRRKLQLSRHSILSREFLRRTQLADRLGNEADRVKHHFSSFAQQKIFYMVTSAIESHIFELNDRESAGAGLELRHAFYDRRIAEFCLRIPQDQRLRGTTTKRVLRNAMRGRLPEKVRTKTAKAEFTDLLETVCRDKNTLQRLESLMIQKHTDWYDHYRLKQHVTELNREIRYGLEHPWRLWMVLATDLWFESIWEAANGAKPPQG